jgi:hypothetical protein
VHSGLDFGLPSITIADAMSQDGTDAAAGGGRRLRRGLEAALLLAAAVLFGAVCSLPLELAARARVAGAPPGWLLPLDDAYIFVRYAQQAARGLPWQWSSGEPSTGSSSALWPWLLVPPHWVSGDLAVWSRWSRWMGVASLWALGLAAVRALRAARLPEPWPLAGALCLVWSGPVGFGATAGMESAANAALVVLACALWMEGLDRPAAWRSARVWALIVTAVLPLARPENGALTLLAALALVAGRGLPWPRWTGAAVLVPGLLLAWLNWRATGSFAPAGALAKSWLYVPFLPFGARVMSYLAVLRRGLLPVYLGANPTALWPPVGLLAAGTAVAAIYAAIAPRRGKARARDSAPGKEQAEGDNQALGGSLATGNVPAPGKCQPVATTRVVASRAVASSPSLAGLARLAPLAAAWLVLAALAPLSILLLWQEMRHHHAGLALAWLLAFGGAGLASEALAARRRERQAAPAVEGRASRWWRAAPLVLPLLLIAAFPHWARESARGTVAFYRGHARATAWLAAHDHRKVLLVTDAGLLSIVHDGPVIDALGLCSPDLTEASLHGPGALVESLARRRLPPAIAAVEPALLKLPLLGEPLLPGPAPAGEITILAEVRRELLAAAAVKAPGLDGLDFAYLPSERRHRLRWHPPPLPPHTSAALPLPGPSAAGGSELSLRGCRPLFGSVELELPPGIAAVSLRAAALAPSVEAEVVVAAGAESGAAGRPLARGRLLPDRWSEVTLALPARGASLLWMARRGPGVPCLQSLRFSARAR